MTKTVNIILISISLMTLNHYAICQPYSTFIENVKSYQDNVKLKGQYSPKHFLIDTTTFNLSTYFGYFDKLEIKPDLKLNYVFCDYGTYGQPALYTKHDSVIIKKYIVQHLDRFYKEIGADKTKIKDEVNDFRREEILFAFAEDSINKAKNNIIPENSKLGYLQYLYFCLFGDNFALKWHSNYTKGNVIYSKDEMKRLYDFYNSTDDFSIEKNSIEEIKELLTKNFEPKIKMNKRNCNITWYEYHLFRGFYQNTYSIDRQPPYNIKKIDEIKIGLIDSHIIY